MRRLLVVAVLVFASLLVMEASARGGKGKKSILDYNEADVERIFQQWEENDEDKDDDDENDFMSMEKLPVNLEDFQKGGQIDPMELMKQAKKNKPVMIFVGIKGDPTEEYTEKVSGRWMQSLQNAHMPVQRYVVAPNRVMFLTQDGSMAWDIKDYLVTQTECTTVTFDQLSSPCAGSEPEEAPNAKTEL